MLRTHLNFMLANVKTPTKTIFVTSTVPEEGKTFVALNNGAITQITADSSKWKISWISDNELVEHVEYFLADQLVGHSLSSIYSYTISESNIGGLPFVEGIYNESSTEVIQPSNLVTSLFPTGSIRINLAGQSEYSYLDESAYGISLDYSTIDEFLINSPSFEYQVCDDFGCNSFQIIINNPYASSGGATINIQNTLDLSYSYFDRTTWEIVSNRYGEKAIVFADPSLTGTSAIIEVPNVGLIREGYEISSTDSSLYSLNPIAEAAFEELLPNLYW